MDQLEDIAAASIQSTGGIVLPPDSSIISGFSHWVRNPIPKDGNEQFFDDHKPYFSDPLVYIFAAYSTISGEEILGLPKQMGVRAISDGIVRLFPRPKPTGFIRISHPNGFDSYYVHVSPSVQTGQNVKAGEVIGLLDELEYTKYRVHHLQFRLNLNGKPININPSIFPDLINA